MPQNFFADIPSDGDNPFEVIENKVEETTSESQTENKQAEVKTQEEDNLPFHKHPRWKQMYDERDEYKTQLEETRKELDDIKQWRKQEEANKGVELPDWWKQAYGTEEASKEAYKAYDSSNRDYKAQIKAEVKQEIQEEQQRLQENQRKSQEALENSFTELKAANPDLDRNELYKFMNDFQNEYGYGALVDSQGNYDLGKAHKLMQKMAPKTPNKTVEVKSEIATQSMSNRAGISREDIPTISSEDLHLGNWRNIIKNR